MREPAVFDDRLFAGSDGFGTFVKCCSYSQMLADIGSKFVVASPDVLYERVTAYDDRGGPVAFEARHWPIKPWVTERTRRVVTASLATNPID